jgi:hypothetical protein
MNNEVKNYSGCRETPKNKEQKKGWRKVSERVGRWMGNTDKNTWLKDMRGNLILVSTVIATMTFQMALNPPGGVRPIKEDANPPGVIKEDSDIPQRSNIADTIGCTLSGSGLHLCPGEAILAVVYPHDYFRFLVSNTICFVASLSICLLLVSGIPLHNRFPIWLLIIGMCVTLTSLTISYTTALTMTTPDPIFDKADKFLLKLLDTWIGLLSCIALLHTLRFVIWGVKFCQKRSKKKAMAQNITKEIPAC